VKGNFEMALKHKSFRLLQGLGIAGLLIWPISLLVWLRMRLQDDYVRILPTLVGELSSFGKFSIPLALWALLGPPLLVVLIFLVSWKRNGAPQVVMVIAALGIYCAEIALWTYPKMQILWVLLTLWALLGPALLVALIIPVSWEKNWSPQVVMVIAALGIFCAGIALWAYTKMPILWVLLALWVLLGPALLVALIILVSWKRNWSPRKAMIVAALGIYCAGITIWTYPKIQIFQAKEDYYCFSNLRKLSRAFFKYESDHGRLPYADSWVDDIYPYVKDWKVFRCHTDRTEGRSSYAMNENLSGVSDVGSEEKTILLYETNKAGSNPHGTGSDVAVPGRHIGEDGSYINWFVLVNGATFWGHSDPRTDSEAHWDRGRGEIHK